MKNPLKNLITWSPSHLITSQKSAFTLAEVLITLAIIGVVAAMTIPTLISDYQEKQTVTKVRKMYSTLSNAHKMIEAMGGYGAISKDFDQNKTVQENSEIFYNLFKPHLKVIKDCGFESGCWTPGYIQSMTGKDYNDYDERGREYKVLLSDGTALMFYANYELEDDINTAPRVAMNIKVDVNGLQKPYQWGRDVFIFNVTNDGVTPAGDINETLFTFEDFCKFSNDDASGEDGIGCTGWVVRKGNMDYLKCDDLTWSKTKCE